MTKSKTKENKVKLQRNRYGCMIDLFQDGEVSIVLDLDRQINHYTNKQKWEMYDIISKTLEDFLIKAGASKKITTNKK